MFDARRGAWATFQFLCASACVEEGVDASRPDGDR